MKRLNPEVTERYESDLSDIGVSSFFSTDPDVQAKFSGVIGMTFRCRSRDGVQRPGAIGPFSTEMDALEWAVKQIESAKRAGVPFNLIVTKQHIGGGEGGWVCYVVVPTEEGSLVVLDKEQTEELFGHKPNV